MTSLGQAVTAFTPLGPQHAVFGLVCVAAATLAFTYLPRVYERSLPLVWLTALLISWVPVQALAFAFEGRRMWLPGEHSAVFFWGDSVLLPLAAVSLALMRREWHRQHAGEPDDAEGGQAPLADTRAWRISVGALAIAIAIGYHANEMWTWTQAELSAPSKLWHDWFVYPVFAYFLATQLPFVWQVRWGGRRALQAAAFTGVALGLAGWWWLGHAYDPSQVASQRPLLLFA